MTGSGILGLMEVLVETSVLTFFESLICLKYTGKILVMLSKKSQSYEHFNDVAFYEIVGRNLLHMQSQILQCSRTYCVLM